MVTEEEQRQWRNSSPFKSTKLEEERALDKGVVFTIRLNEEEYEELKLFKDMMGTDQDSTALKAAAEVGLKVVLQPLWQTRTFKRLFKKGVKFNEF